MSEAEANPAVIDALVENHRRFLAFLERRLTSRAEAEDILPGGLRPRHRKERLHP